MKIPSQLALAVIVLFVIVDRTIAEETEEQFRTVVHHVGDEEEVSILDAKGEVVGVVDIFEHQGYQIDKPADDPNSCLLRKIDDFIEEEDNGTDICYKRGEISDVDSMNMNMSSIIEHCGNRSIYVLQPQECDKMYTPETGEHRSKRFWRPNYYCNYVTYKSVRCSRWETTRDCCFRIFVCLWRCKVCRSYSVRYITELRCYYG